MQLKGLMLDNFNVKRTFGADNKYQYDVLRQEILNDKIFNIREKTIQKNEDYHTLFLASELIYTNLCMGDDYKNLKLNVTYPVLLFLGLTNLIMKSKSSNENYKNNLIQYKLKKEKKSEALMLGLLPGVLLVINAFKGNLKTKEAKMRGFLGIGLSVLTSFAFNFLKNKNIENCEKEVNNVYK